MLLFSSENISGPVTPVTQPSPRPSRCSIHIAIDNLVIVDYKGIPAVHLKNYKNVKDEDITLIVAQKHRPLT